MPEQFGRVASLCFGCAGVFESGESLAAAERILPDLAARPGALPATHRLLGMLRAEQGRLPEAWDAFRAAYPDATLHYATTKAPRDYCAATYGPDDFLVFGRETKGLDEALLAEHYDRCIRIPMRPDARSLNLSNSVAIVLYEALRQQGFPGLSGRGQLHHTEVVGREWKDYV